jgi:hypothetical protein
VATQKESQSKWIMVHDVCLQGSLLMALTTLVTNSRAQPNYILCFPGTAAFDAAPSRRPSGSNSPTNDSPTGDNNAAGNLAFTLHQQHMRAGMDSCVVFYMVFYEYFRNRDSVLEYYYGGKGKLGIFWFSWREK